MICHAYTTPEPVGRLLAGLAQCCIGAFEEGPGSCTCWEPEYDLDQAPIQPGQPATRSKMCGDCAFRPDSPERTGDDRYTHVDEDLTALPNFVAVGVGLDDNAERVAPSDGLADALVAVDPPIRGGVPYMSPGVPSALCAGWAAHQPSAVETA